MLKYRNAFAISLGLTLVAEIVMADDPGSSNGQTPLPSAKPVLIESLPSTLYDKTTITIVSIDGENKYMNITGDVAFLAR